MNWLAELQGYNLGSKTSMTVKDANKNAWMLTSLQKGKVFKNLISLRSPDGDRGRDRVPSLSMSKQLDQHNAL